MAPQNDPLSRLPYHALCAQKVRWAVGVAALNAWSFAVFAVASGVLLILSTLSGGFTLAALGITVALFAVAYFEFRGKRMLKELNPDGCRVLGWNQLALLAALTAYCGWSIAWGFLYPSNFAQEIAEHPELLASYSEVQRRDMQDMFNIIDDIWPALITSIYGAVIIASVLYQGGNAWYYFARRKAVEECRAMADGAPGKTPHGWQSGPTDDKS